MKHLKMALLGMACAAAFAATASAEDFNIPAGDLKSALTTYAKQTGIPLIVSGEAIRGVATQGAKGAFSSEAALSRILAGTGFAVRRHTDAGITIVPETHSSDLPPMQLAQAA